MPIISDRGEQAPASPIRKLVPFAEKAKEKGVEIYHLNIGQPDIETPEIARREVKENNLEVIEYSHSAGNLSLREKITGYYKKHDISITADEILITTGGSEAIQFAMLSCLNPGDEIIIPEPFYANYVGFAVAAGIQIKTLTSSIETGFALPPIAEFEKQISSKTKAILITSPNNPTGYLYSREEMDLIRDLVVKHDLFFFSDEAYREFCYDGKEYTSVMHLDGIDDKAILLDSMSKRYSACGIRIGALISKNKDVIDASMKFAQARLSPPSYGQIASEAAIDTPDSYFKMVISDYVARRNVVVESINKMEGAFCPEPSGAFYVVAKLPIDSGDKFCQWLLEEFDYEGETVMMAPASGFYNTPGLGEDEVRISYVLNVNDLRKAMRCLAEGLKVYPGKTN